MVSFNVVVISLVSPLVLISFISPSYFISFFIQHSFFLISFLLHLYSITSASNSKNEFKLLKTCQYCIHYRHTKHPLPNSGNISNIAFPVNMFSVNNICSLLVNTSIPARDIGKRSKTLEIIPPIPSIPSKKHKTKANFHSL